jgi:2-iminoacetate synthase ThiH
MIVGSASSSKKYTVGDLYSEAAKMIRQEMQGIKKEPLTPAEETKLANLAKSLSQSVLKEMNIA